ncbi:hypothetical protein [Saccharibacillus sp. JS10]|uniref:hypothetical protein n=1 Tax=Saccharibacillus sp. JS10 TaxID=2950552 RepID=UPI00210979C4|nr:hypothetical protein [Saccharibacillus sp. JS10]MCQ4085871.1 hypothetical protein [Saccharibacillus sp. JS10]
MKTKVPKSIRVAIKKAAEYRAKATVHENVIEDWFEMLGISEDDEFRDTYIDCVQQSQNPEEAIRRFEIMID